MEPEPLLDSLRNAVAAMPDDVPLRLHLATMLLRSGQRDEAVRHLGAVLQRDPAMDDPGPADTLAMEQLLTKHRIDVLLYNVQTVTPVTTKVWKPCCTTVTE